MDMTKTVRPRKETETISASLGGGDDGHCNAHGYDHGAMVAVIFTLVLVLTAVAAAAVGEKEDAQDWSVGWLAGWLVGWWAHNLRMPRSADMNGCSRPESEGTRMGTDSATLRGSSSRRGTASRRK